MTKIENWDFCDQCNRIVSGLENHMKSKAHIYYFQIKEWLKDDRITLQQMGDQMGLSRERVRQIIKTTFPEVAGRIHRRVIERWKQIDAEREEYRKRKVARDPALKSLRSVCLSRGIKFELESPTNHRFAILNGHKCRVKKAYAAGPHGNYLRGGDPGPRPDAEFFIFTYGGNWWIFPSEICNWPQTFSPRDGMSPYFRSEHVPKLQAWLYKNAWHLLKETKNVRMGPRAAPEVQNAASGHGER